MTYFKKIIGEKCKAHDIIIMDILSTEFESPFVKKFFE